MIAIQASACAYKKSSLCDFNDTLWGNPAAAAVCFEIRTQQSCRNPDGAPRSRTARILGSSNALRSHRELPLCTRIIVGTFNMTTTHTRRAHLVPWNDQMRHWTCIPECTRSKRNTTIRSDVHTVHIRTQRNRPAEQVSAHVFFCCELKGSGTKWDKEELLYMKFHGQDLH